MAPATPGLGERPTAVRVVGAAFRSTSTQVDADVQLIDEEFGV